MITYDDFVAGLGMIALKLNQPLGDPKAIAYHEDFEDETDPMEWSAFTRIAVRRFGWKFIPSVPELLDALREFRGAPPLDQEAAQRYEDVIAAGVYTAEGGTTWNYRTVLERCGKAAADAFLAAGGHHAFASSWDEAKRRERFLAAYRAEARALPASRLIEGGKEPRLIEAEVTSSAAAGEPALTAEQARAAMRKLDAMVPAARVPATLRLSTDEWEARKRALQEQGRAIAQESPQETETTNSGEDAARR